MIPPFWRPAVWVTTGDRSTVDLMGLGEDCFRRRRSTIREPPNFLICLLFLC